MLSRNNLLKAAIAASAVFAAVALGAPRASADDNRWAVAPAVAHGDYATANVQLVGWGRPYGYRYGGYYRPYARPYYYRSYGGYYGPAYGGYYRGYAAPYPAYGYGYAYPTYSYGYPAYGYPAYGYPVYGGIGVRTGRVGVAVW
jgi:hypothetical protein